MRGSKIDRKGREASVTSTVVSIQAEVDDSKYTVVSLFYGDRNNVKAGMEI